MVVTVGLLSVSTVSSLHMNDIPFNKQEGHGIFETCCSKDKSLKIEVSKKV